MITGEEFGLARFKSVQIGSKRVNNPEVHSGVVVFIHHRTGDCSRLWSQLTDRYTDTVDTHRQLAAPAGQQSRATGRMGHRGGGAGCAPTPGCAGSVTLANVS